jgi:hypothetical protein
MSNSAKKQSMESAVEIAKYTLPALVVFLTVFVMMRTMIKREAQFLSRERTQEQLKTVLPIRLQAYERLALLLERISPETLIMRVSKPGISARQMHNELLSSIRAEFEHNLSQQVYISSEAWELIKTARANLVTLINTAADQVKEDANALTLSQKIFELASELKSPPVSRALEFLKQEMRQFL